MLILDAGELQVPPGALPPRWADSVRAVCQLETELLLILDAGRLIERPTLDNEA